MDDERTAYAMAGMRPEPLPLPPAICAARLPRGFRRLLDDFAREVLRLQPCDLDEFGSAYFSELVQSRRQNGGVLPEYQPKVSYIKAQYEQGNTVAVPTEDQNLMATQTTGSDHYFVPPRDGDQEEDGAETYGDEKAPNVGGSDRLTVHQVEEQPETAPFATNSKLDTSVFAPSVLEVASTAEETGGTYTSSNGAEPVSENEKPSTPKQTSSQPQVPPEAFSAYAVTGKVHGKADIEIDDQFKQSSVSDVAAQDNQTTVKFLRSLKIF